MRNTTLLAATALCWCATSPAAAEEYQIPLFISQSNAMQQGFVRIINHSDQAGTVSVHAIDDDGAVKGPRDITLEARHTLHFNSDDLESGNPVDKPDKVPGLETGIGGGSGDWRLLLETDLDIEPLVYVRTDDGFLTSMHDVVPVASMRHEVAIFNPAQNPNQVSRLRLINPGDSSLSITIKGVDDKGMEPEGAPIELDLDGGKARTITATQLEDGDSDFTGSFGDGTGKWRLFVEADGEILVMSLLESTMTGHLTNLSTRTYEMLAPVEQAAFDRLMSAGRE